MRPIRTASAIALAATLAFAPAALVTSAALAQTAAPSDTPVGNAPAASVNTTPQTSNSPHPSAVQTTSTMARTAAAPVPGRNSFTAGEARSRIASAGFTNVSALKKDRQGIWRGQAQKDGAAVAVSLDYQGNVTGK